MNESALYRLSASDFPLAQRENAIREQVWRGMNSMDYTPLDKAPLEFELALLTLPKLYIQSVQMSSASLWRDSELARNSEDRYALVSWNKGPIRAQCNTHAIECSVSQSMLLYAPEPFQVISPKSQFICLDVSKKALQPLLGQRSLPPLRSIGHNDAYRFLMNYLKLLLQHPELIAEPIMQQMASTHILELLALTIGTQEDIAHEQLSNSMAAARLREAKAYIHRHLSDEHLTIACVAKHLNVSIRSIQKLFEKEETTYAHFVLEQRLARARHYLQSPSWAQHSITHIALEVGFSDISYFCRCFRKRYHQTPTDVRQQTSTAQPG